MKKYSANKHHTLSELNITPLLDLAFVLLVIFILTTAPPINTQDITLPSAASNPKESPPKAYHITIQNSGKVWLNANEMSLDQLQGMLVEFRKIDPDLNVIVHGDSRVQYQKITDVLDVLIAANIAKVGLATEGVRQ
jgi:biopolymer transport protein ExbD